MSGKLYYRYAAMAAGKSTSLLQIAHNYEEQSQRVTVFTAGIDDRYGVGKVTSRLGVSRDARVFSSDTDFLQEVWQPGPPACVLIDEAQFLSEAQVRQLHRLAHAYNVPVICFGIRTDFQGNAFPGSAALLALADDLEELKTICRCGRKASMNMRVDAAGNRVTEGAQVEIGGDSRYRSVCPRCFYLPSLPGLPAAAPAKSEGATA